MHLSIWTALAMLLLPILLLGAKASASLELAHVGGMYLGGMTRLGGSHPQDYEWGVTEDAGASYGQWMNGILFLDGWFDDKNDRVADSVWIKARSYANRDVLSYATVSQELDAGPYVGRRITYAAFIKCDGVIGGYKKGYAVLFARVVSAGGRTLAFDNMTGRHIPCPPEPEAWGVDAGHSIVIDVPGPPPGVISCPGDPNDVAAFIDLGFILCGGQGRVQVIAPTVKVVHYGWEVTGGPPPWREPGINYL